MGFYDLLFLLVILVSSAVALPPCVCTRNIKYVCGSDGKTYANQCILECESSKHDNQITLQRNGRCEDAVEPCTICTLEYRPVCGSDGKSYPNECVFDCEKSKNPELTFTAGDCKQDEPCKITMEYKPVCGSDGKDYPNLSSLECEKRSHPGLTHTEGVCKHKEECMVTLDYRPVCGSDGKDYPNPSAVECERRSNPELTYTHGVCKKHEVKAIADISDCVCVRKMEPVCGNDGHTYNNKCLLECAQNSRKDLKLEHEGTCKDDELKSINPKCICVRKLEPVCASNGVSYDNSCLMECAGDDLTVVSEGPCP